VLVMITKEEILMAIRQGVRDALLEAIQSYDIEGAVRDGVCQSMPFAELILGAFTDGVKEAAREGH
jgi:hypothetical protein